MFKALWLGILTFCIAFSATGQNDIVFSHYMFNPIFYNPAQVSQEDEAHFNFQVRSQWTGYASTFDGTGGAPNTQTLGATIPIVGSLSGIGLIAVNDNLGPVNNVIVNVPVGYSFKIRYGQLHLGLSPGFYSQTQRFDELRFNDPSDPFNVGSRESQLNFNLSAGLLYTSPSELYVGLSATNLLEPSFDFGIDSLENKLIRTLNFTGGITKNINRNLSLQPSLLVRSDIRSFSFDVSTIVRFKDKAWGGLSYRWSEALVFMVGYSFLPGNKLQVGYALDYVIDEQDAKQPTSQEILIRLNFPDLLLGGRKQVKTPRFTF
jgi:type IX secretion system PorP/SprF family membrane protein